MITYIQQQKKRRKNIVSFFHRRKYDSISERLSNEKKSICPSMKYTGQEKDKGKHFSNKLF